MGDFLMSSCQKKSMASLLQKSDNKIFYYAKRKYTGTNGKHFPNN